MKWRVDIDNFMGGFAPAWYNGGSYPTYGNKNQAASMTNIDLTNPGYLQQGPGLANLTNGTQADAVTTLLQSIIDEAVTSNVTYGIGGSKLYQISASTVTSGGGWPYSITATSGSAVGEDLAVYQGNLYYTYNNAVAGEIGKYDLSSTFDDDWGTTTPSGATALQDAPHPIVVGNDVMYIGNGRYVATYDGTTLVDQAVDFPTGSEVSALAYLNDRLWVASNFPNLTGSNKNASAIYVWDGTTNSWELEIKLMGLIGALHVKNGVVFVWYQDITSTGGYKLAYISGGSVVDLVNYTGALPSYYNVTDYKDFILWNAGGSLFAYGAGDKDLPLRLFQIADGGYATVGALACPFGTPLVASTETTNFKLAKFSGFDVNSSWKSLTFDVTGETGLSRINTLIFNFDVLASGARLDWVIRDNKGTAIHSDTISYAKLGAATSCKYELGKLAENFRLELNYANGSTSATVALRNVRIYGADGQ